MKTIYKYTLPVRDDCQVSMPEFAKILSVGYQNDPSVLYIWAEIETANAPVIRHFQVRGTGHPLGDLIQADGKYIGTVNCMGQGLVWHVYEVKP
jgi:hypothetical protein